MSTDHLLVFTRYPESGKVKTRLIPALGAAGAALVHRQMAEHTLAEVNNLLQSRRSLRVEIYFSNDGNSAALMPTWLGDSWTYCPQMAGDLGQKLTQAFTAAFAQGSSHVIAIGTDCPDLNAELMAMALDYLQTHDLVLGMASDGGYYLIGLRRDAQRESPFPQLFQHIDWGTDQVLAQTVKIATALNLAIAFLPTLSDVDRPEDLAIWQKFLDRSNNQMPRISVIVPVLNEAATIKRFMTHLFEQMDEQVEAIAIDGGSTDQTVALLENLGQDLGLRVLTAAAGRGSQMNAGAAAARGEILLFLHADTILPKNFAPMVRATFPLNQSHPIAGAFALQIDGNLPSLRLVEWGVYWRSHLWQLPYGDQAIFLKTATFHQLGGFAELPIMEDFELVTRLQKLGAIAILPTPVITSARRWLRRGVFQTTLINQIMILGYRLGIAPQRLASWYRQDFRTSIKKTKKLRLALLFLGIFTLVFLWHFPAIAQSTQNSSGFNQWFQQALQWVQDLGAVGAIAFILIYIVATVVFIPGTILTLGAGVVFGVVAGAIYVWIGATLGATAAFLIGRYGVRDWVSKKIEGNPKFQAIDEAVGREGLKIVLLTRLSPVFPFILLNYAYGLTKVSLKDFVIGSIGMIPATITYVYLGSLAGSIAAIASSAQPISKIPPNWQWGIQIIGLIATVAVTIYITRLATKALATHIE